MHKIVLGDYEQKPARKQPFPDVSGGQGGTGRGRPRLARMLNHPLQGIDSGNLGGPLGSVRLWSRRLFPNRGDVRLLVSK